MKNGLIFIWVLTARRSDLGMLSESTLPERCDRSGHSYGKKVLRTVGRQIFFLLTQFSVLITDSSG
jgi:hypothetical protein